MLRPGNARWAVFALTVALLGVTLPPAPPTLAAPQGVEQGKAAKGNAAVAKRLQRQREHMERQRERIKQNRMRFKAQRERRRQRLKEEEAKAKALTSAGQAGQAPAGTEPGAGMDPEPDPEDGGTEIWSGFFPWVTGGDFSDNLPTGLGLAGLGAIGAMILIFGLIGSYLPSMGGKGKYEALLLEIEILEGRRNEQIASREKYVRSGTDPGPERRQEAGKLTQDLSQAIESKKAEAKQAYRQVLWLGIPIYVVVGGALAVLLATNALQALLIGFAWTSIADRLGLKREQGEKQAAKIENVEELTQRAKDGEQAAIELAAEKKVNKEFSKLLRDWEKKGITTQEFKAQSAEVVDPVAKPEEPVPQDPVQLEQIDAAAKMLREL